MEIDQETAEAAIQAGRLAAATIKTGSEFSLSDDEQRSTFSKGIIDAMNKVLQDYSFIDGYTSLAEQNFEEIAAKDTFEIGVRDSLTKTIVASADLKFTEVDIVL